VISVTDITTMLKDVADKLDCDIRLLEDKPEGYHCRVVFDVGKDYFLIDPILADRQFYDEFVYYWEGRLLDIREKLREDAPSVSLVSIANEISLAIQLFLKKRQFIPTVEIEVDGTNQFNKIYHVKLYLVFLVQPTTLEIEITEKELMQAGAQRIADEMDIKYRRKLSQIA